MRFTGVAATLLMYHSTVLQHCEGSVRYRKGYTSVQMDSDDSDKEEGTSVLGSSLTGSLDDIVTRNLESVNATGATPSSGDAPKLKKTTGVIKPFAPPNIGAWKTHFIQRTLTISRRQRRRMGLGGLTRPPDENITYTFNSWTRLVGQGLVFALEVPSLLYTLEGKEAKKIAEVQKLCGAPPNQSSSTRYITVCTVKLTELPQAFIDPNSGLPTIKMKASSVNTRVTDDMTIEFIYDNTGDAYGAFMAHALMLEETYKESRAGDEDLSDHHVLQSEAQGFKRLHDPWWTKVRTEGQDTSGESSDDDSDSDSASSSSDDSTADDVTSACEGYRSDDAAPETSLISRSSMPPYAFYIMGYDFFNPRGTWLQWMSSIEIAPRACIPFTSTKGQKMMFTPLRAAFGGPDIDAKMAVYMVQVGVSESFCRATVEVFTLTAIYYSDYLGGGNEQTKTAEEDKKIMTEITKNVPYDSTGRDEKFSTFSKLTGLPERPSSRPVRRIAVHD
ncbi:hypothetical protein FOZ61_007465 [Perkinsus olseni]|uniref:Uncharacterized protein n=1 Tax=Perkinsus olseni TaxID=32597 RepID=A0A7J6L8W2_PEROL|nr:hypothetical protein FOZ61_007465 [Perkinsus olseni]KAF4658990.1 hypothetical protein FOL46_006769 [Perkinsus olseni]